MKINLVNNLCSCVIKFLKGASLSTEDTVTYRSENPLFSSPSYLGS